MTDLEFFASNPDVKYRLRKAYEGETLEDTLVSVHRTCEGIECRIAPPETVETSNERLARYAFDEGLEIN